MGELRQRPVKGAPVRLRKQRRKNLTSDEKIAMLAQYTAVTKEEADGRMLPGAAKRLTEEYGVSRSYITQRLLPQAKDATRKNRFHYQSHERKPRLFTPEVDDFVIDKGLQWEGDFTWKEMAQAVNKEFRLERGRPSAEGLRSHCRKKGWTTGKLHVLPYLSEEHRQRRLEWATEHATNDWTACVDIDEKWFYTVKWYIRRKMHPDHKIPPKFIKSKRNPPKVMFLSAIARPRPLDNFDGKIGMFRVSMEKTAGPRSRVRAPGTTYELDVSMDADLYFAMMTEQVFPAIVVAFKGTNLPRSTE